MATNEEIERRVEETDSPRTVKRAAAAKRVSDLAQRRAVIAEQLANIERELGEVLAESSDVIGTDELATFTDVPVADLNQWLNDRKTIRTKRKKYPAGPSASKRDTSRGMPAETPTPSQKPMVPASAPRPVAAPARVPVEVT